MNSFPPIPASMVKFINKHHLLTLATSSQDQPWCCSCFYAFDETNLQLIFTSDMHTRHITHILENPKVAGAIALETKIIGKIQGIQFTGEAFLLENKELDKARKTYLFKFPFAILAQTPLWAVKLHTLKMTDNKLGFGKKLYWPQTP